MRLSLQTLWSVVASVALFGALPLVGATAVMQVDLLFPRDNQVYAPTPYMPIVFSVQNIHLARHTFPSMAVQLFNNSDYEERQGKLYR